MKRKIVCLVLALLMLISIMPISAFAAQTKSERSLQFEENIAAELKKINLFKGVSDTDFALGRVPSRIEALVIMLRLMGKETEILAGEYKHPFTDVPAWANKYVGYAFENKLTNGISATEFGVGDASDVQFITFVLRAMNYSDANGDFSWDNPYDLAEQLGILNDSVVKGKAFLRADCALVSYNALAAKLNGQTKTLADKLMAAKVFSKADYSAVVANVKTLDEIRKINPFENIPAETPEQKERFAELMKYWDRFDLQKDSKGLTLSWDQARALVGQDIMVVKQYVKTIADCMYYLCASGYGQEGGDVQVSIEGKGGEWHFNRSAETVFAENCGDCGGTSNLIAYLLAGDYDEVGYINYSSAPRQGGHVVNYVKNGNTYLGIDMVSPFGGYRHGINLHAGSDLNKVAYDTMTSYGHDAMFIYTYKGEKGDFPIGWTGEKTQYAIEGYDDTVNIVYAAEGYKMVELKQSQSVLNKIEKLRNTMWYANPGDEHKPSQYQTEEQSK